MGLDSEHAARVVFDIETAPLDDAAEYIESAEAPSHYKDPLKIADYIAKANADQLEKCSLDVDLCRVIAIGWWPEGAERPAVMSQGDEATMLRAFWQLVAGDRHLVGFNCLGFDLPVLLRRSLYLGVAAPHLQIDRFKHPRVTDVMDELSFGGKLKFRGLSFYAKRFNLGIEETLTGADIAQAVKDGRWAEIEDHVKADVKKTAALATRLGYFHQVTEAVL